MVAAQGTIDQPGIAGTIFGVGVDASAIVSRISTEYAVN
jgi:hypothetical protein